MKKLFKYFYNKLYNTNNEHYTEIKFTFDDKTSNPQVSLHISDLNDRTAQEIAQIFYIFQTGAVQQFLIDKITNISEDNNKIFLENIYNNFNKLNSNKNKKQHKHPMVRPLMVFNNASNH
jgi:hypothetical protein